MNPFEILIIVLIAILLIGMIYNTTTKILTSKTSKGRLPKIDFISNPSDIHNMVNLAIKEKARVKLRINNREPSYNTSIIKKESLLNHHALLIDFLFPPEGNDRIQYSKSVVAEFSINRNHRGGLFHAQRTGPVIYIRQLHNESGNNAKKMRAIVCP